MRGGPPPPPVVGQLVATLPDGSIDPASATDCGEACLSAAFAGWRRLHVSPGCIRDALGKPSWDGRTTAADIVRFADAVGMPSRSWDGSGPNQPLLKRALSRGRYVMLLGNWDGPSVLHWVLAYGFHPDGVWVMDPWPAQLRLISWHDVRVLSAGVSVHIQTG